MRKTQQLICRCVQTVVNNNCYRLSSWADSVYIAAIAAVRLVILFHCSLSAAVYLSNANYSQNTRARARNQSYDKKHICRLARNTLLFRLFVSGCIFVPCSSPSSHLCLVFYTAIGLQYLFCTTLYPSDIVDRTVLTSFTYFRKRSSDYIYTRLLYLALPPPHTVYHSNRVSTIKECYK